MSLKLKSGEIIAILGDNGSGESTLVKILSGDIKADSGAININSEFLKKLSSEKAIEKGFPTVIKILL